MVNRSLSPWPLWFTSNTRTITVPGQSIWEGEDQLGREHAAYPMSHSISTGTHTAETGLKQAHPKKKGFDQIKTISGHCTASISTKERWE